MSILNVYDLYEGRQILWNVISSYQWIKYDNMVIDGDLNLIVNNKEIWGGSVRIDRIVDFFRTQFDSFGWVDIKPYK